MKDLTGMKKKELQMMSKLWIGMVVMIMAFASLGCSDDINSEDINNVEKEDEEEELIGNWPAMKWEVVDTEGNIDVKFEGYPNIINVDAPDAASIELRCSNYSDFWFADKMDTRSDISELFQWENEWVSLRIEDDRLICDFSALEYYYNDEIWIEVTAGDIFDTFCFVRNSENRLPEEIDGSWDPMEWSVKDVTGDIDVDFISDAFVNVTIQSAGTLKLECDNYQSFWFDASNYYPATPESFYTYNEQFVNLSIEGNVISCHFPENRLLPFPEEIPVIVTAGDIFCHITFINQP